MALAAALCALTACGSTATTPTTTTAFALDAGNYTLKLSGSGICSSSGTGPREGSASVTVTRDGTTWTVRSVQAGDTFFGSFTTDNAAPGMVWGSINNNLSGESGMTIATGASLTGNNPSKNVAGGPVTTQSLSVALYFSQPSGTGFCTTGTWTLTPR